MYCSLSEHCISKDTHTQEHTHLQSHINILAVITKHYVTNKLGEQSFCEEEPSSLFRLFFSNSSWKENKNSDRERVRRNDRNKSWTQSYNCTCWFEFGLFNDFLTLFLTFEDSCVWLFIFQTNFISAFHTQSCRETWGKKKSQNSSFTNTHFFLPHINWQEAITRSTLELDFFMTQCLLSHVELINHAYSCDSRTFLQFNFQDTVFESTHLSSFHLSYLFSSIIAVLMVIRFWLPLSSILSSFFIYLHIGAQHLQFSLTVHPVDQLGSGKWWESCCSTIGPTLIRRNIITTDRGSNISDNEIFKGRGGWGM